MTVESEDLVDTIDADSTSEMLASPMPKFLEDSLGGLYNIYFKLLKMRGLSRRRQFDDSPIESTLGGEDCNSDLFVIDERATRIGSAYRGIGILIGVLGAAIILCALLPVGLALSSISVTIVGITKVILMVVLLAILFATRKLELKERWVDLRHAAECKRYERLRNLIQAAEADHLVSNIESLRAEVNRHIGGSTDCQILYNNRKRTEYEGIEAFSTRLTYAAFTASFIGAAAHLVLHASWLIFLTAYVPALVGAMHAVNSFLRLPQLIEQHGEMVLLLSGLFDQFAADASLAGSPERFLSLSRQLLNRLENADARWLGIASHQNLHPG